MITLTEDQLLAWITPVLWSFLRVLALFTSLPVMSQRSVPARVRVALAFFTALCAAGTGPQPAPVPLDSPAAFMLVAQQLVIGLALGFAVRVVFASVEFAGELMGLQMGLNFAGFFDPITATQATATSRFFGTLAAFLFVAMNGHLLVIEAVVQSLVAFPVSPEPFGFLRATRPELWGGEIFRLGFWIALPMVGTMLFTNMVLGVIARVAPQVGIFAVGFPMTVSLGLVGLVFTLPMLQQPFVGALERMLGFFR